MINFDTRNIPRQIWLMIGITIFSLSYLIVFYVPFILPRIFQIVGLLIIIRCLISNKYYLPKSPTKVVLQLFLVWTIIMILRGSFIGNFLPGNHSFYDVIYTAFSYDNSVFAYLIPFIALMPLRLNSLYYFKRIGIFLCFVSVFLVIINYNWLFSSNVEVGLSSFELLGNRVSVRLLALSFFLVNYLIVFLSFCYGYIRSRFRLIIIIYLFLWLICMVIGGGRGDSILILLYLLLSFYLFYKYPIEHSPKFQNDKRASTINKTISISFFICFGFLILYLLYYTNTFNYLLERTFINGKSGELLESSRETLVKEMTSDFNTRPLDWLWGRGINGAFKTNTDLGIEGYRDGIEWGYLYFILKGGIVYLLMYVYLLTHATYMGIFNSKNMLCKSMALICLIAIISLATTAIPGISIRWFFTWFCYGMLENKRVRMLNNQTIYKFFNFKDYKI